MEVSTIKALIKQGQDAANQGKPDLACELLLKAADQAGRNQEILFSIAAELEEIKRLGKASEIYLRILEIKPDNGEAHIALGRIYLTQNQLNFALVHYQHAVNSEPDNSDYLFQLGKVYQGLSDIDKALDCFQKALLLGNDKAAVYRFLAMDLELVNRLDEMESLLNKAIKKYPDDNAFYFLKAKCETRKGNLQAALDELKILETQALEYSAKVKVNFELAWIYDKMDRPEEAYPHFQEGNRIRLKDYELNNIDLEQAKNDVAKMSELDLGKIKTFVTDTKDLQTQDPIFLVGFPRSGTTLLHRILASHKDVDVLEEISIFILLRHQFNKLKDNYPRGLLSLDGADIKYLRDKYWELAEKLGGADTNKVVVDKLPLNIIHIPFIYSLFPKAKFIIALRHPCDCTLSCFMQNFGPNSEMANFLELGTATEFYKNVMGSWLHYRENLQLNFTTVKYEDIVENFEKEIRKLIKFMAIEWDPEVLNYRKKAQSTKFVNTPSYSQVIKPIYKDATGRWKKYSKFFDPYLDELTPFITEFGYEN